VFFLTISFVTVERIEKEDKRGDISYVIQEFYLKTIFLSLSLSFQVAA